LVIINFLYFKKSFDSVHRGSLWKIMKKYGIPTKIIEVVKSLYEDGRSAVRWGGVVGEWFQAGMCAIAHTVIALVVSWVMKRTMKNRNFGLRWIEEGRLGDLNFADVPCWKTRKRG